MIKTRPQSHCSFSAFEIYFSFRICDSSPFSCICLRISHPPTNSPSTKTCKVEKVINDRRPVDGNGVTCGIVGQFENFLMLSRRSGSSNTFRLPYFAPVTSQQPYSSRTSVIRAPYASRIRQATLLKPHIGASGTPYMHHPFVHKSIHDTTFI